MNYIYEFLKKCEKAESAPTLSEFITKSGSLVINNVDYAEEVVTWKTVKQYWTNKFDKALRYKSVKGANDCWTIDWDELAKNINEKRRKRKIEEAADILANELTNEVTKRTKIYREDDNENPFLDEDKDAVDYLSIFNNIKHYRKNINGASTDLVAHGILDLVSKDKQTLTKECLGPMFDNLYSKLKELNKGNDNMTYMDASASTVKSYISALIKDKNDPVKLKKVLNDTKEVSEKNEDTSWIRVVLKLAKVYAKQIRNEKNYLEREQTEYNYIMSFWFPLFHRLLRDDSRYEIMWGDGSLRAAKDMGDRKLNDDERRSKGPSTDGTIIYDSSGLEVAIIEVSGPPENGHHAHFIGDRNKIAINLKKSIKKIIEKNPSANKAVLAKIALLGIQVYKHQLYLYKLTMPTFDLYVFTEIQKVQLPVKIYDAHRDLPTMIAALWTIKISLDQTVNLLDQANDDYDSEDDATIDDFTFNDTPPRPKSKKKIQTTRSSPSP